MSKKNYKYVYLFAAIVFLVVTFYLFVFEYFIYAFYILVFVNLVIISYFIYKEFLLKKRLKKISHTITEDENVLNILNDIENMETKDTDIASFRKLVLQNSLYENKIKTIYQISQLIINSSSTNNILNGILKEVALFFGAKSGSIMLWDENHNNLMIKNVYNLDEKYIGKSIAFGTGVAGYVALTGESVIIRNSEKHPKNFNISRKDIFNSIVYPIMFQKDLIGVISLNNPSLIDFMDDTDIKGLMASFANQAGIIILNNKLISKLTLTYKSTIKTLVYAIDAKDPYTAGHSERVTSYALDLAKKLDFDNKMLERLEFASLLHDIGKIGIPEDILRKPSRLTDEEFNVIKTHPTVSAKIVKPAELPWDITDDVLSHHERWDGKGYPLNKKMNEISLYGRVIAIADAFDAMTSDRPYRSGMDLGEASEEITRNLGKQFDPEIGLIFVKLLKNSTIRIIK